jgi:hypothetical protein
MCYFSPSSRLKQGKIAYFLGLEDHVCSLLKVNIAIIFAILNKQNLFITYTTHFIRFQSSETLIFNKSHYTDVTHCWNK